MEMVVTIDGPSGCGKSTVAKALAMDLGFYYIDTGAMYRALAYILNKKKIAFSDQQKIIDFLQTIELVYTYDFGNLVIKIDGEDLTKYIRNEEVSLLASQLGKIESIRNYLKKFQRGLVFDGVSIMEGRDIGTVIFPESFCKIFLTASNEIRAKRRFAQLIERGESPIYDEVLRDLIKRDLNDGQRELAPLKQADDAHLVLTDRMSLEKVVGRIKKIIIKCAKNKNIALGQK